MATPSGASAMAAALPLAPPPATTDTMSSTATPALTTTAKNLEQLMKEIDEAKVLVDTTTKRLDKIELGRKRTVAARDEAIAGRTELEGLKGKITNLQTQVNATASATDPTPRTFEKRQKNANNALKDLVKKVDNADKRLEKGIGPMPAPPAATAGALATTTPAIGTPAPAAGATAPAEAENAKGIRSFVDKIPLLKKKTASKESLNATPPTTVPPPATTAADTTKKPVKDTAADEEDDDDEDVEGSDIDDDDDDEDVVSEKKSEAKKILPPVKKTGPPQIESDDSDDTDDDDDVADDADDRRQLLTALQRTEEANKDSIPSGRRSQTPTGGHGDKLVPPIKLDSARTESPKPKKAITTASPLPPTRKKAPSPKRRTQVPAPKEEDSEDSYFEEGEEGDEEDEEELRRLGGTGEQGEVESDHDYGEDEDEGESAAVNTRTQELRSNTYPPGTQFIVTQDFTGVQTGDLTIQRGEILTLVEQRPDDWWLLKSTQTQQAGVVPINHIQLMPRAPRLRAKPSTSATNLVDAFKANNSIPIGFTASDLAPLAELEEYKVSRSLVPRMTESNLAFADLHWRVDNDRLHVHDVTYQKILTIKECVKIPRAKGDQIRVLDRCVRVCLYDGYEIVSNIHTVRAHMNKKLDDRDLTEDWTFLPNDNKTLVDEQSQILLRSNRINPDQHLNLLIELSQWCQSTVTQEKCEVACGWSIVPLQDEKPPLISDTKSYNELLHGGHAAEKDVLLDPQYKILRSDGLSGMIDRFKRARVKFSIESRETDVDLIYDTLPIQPIVVPMNLIKCLYFYRSELAYQLHKRPHPTGLSTTPIDSLFLSTFFQTLSQPDLIHTLRQQYNIRKRRVLNSSSSPQQQREEFIHTYEKFIYPLLQYRQLPSYDFHDILALNERRKLILEMVKRQTPNKRTPPEDILSILLDPKLTDKWTPFSTDETCFTLQKYTSYFSPDLVA